MGAYSKNLCKMPGLSNHQIVVLRNRYAKRLRNEMNKFWWAGKIHIGFSYDVFYLRYMRS